MKKKRSMQGMLLFSILLSLIFSFSFISVKQAVPLVRAEVVMDGKITDKEYPQSKTFDKGNFERKRHTLPTLTNSFIRCVGA
jgi:hypothetical protein